MKNKRIRVSNRDGVGKKEVAAMAAVVDRPLDHTLEPKGFAVVIVGLSSAEVEAIRNHDRSFFVEQLPDETPIAPGSEHRQRQVFVD